MKRLSFIVIVILFSTNLFSQGRLFTYTYQTEVLTNHEHDFEVWNTVHLEKLSRYGELDTRFEYELGLGKNLETAFFLNTRILSQHLDNNATYRTTDLSFSNEWKLRLTDSEEKRFGTAVFEEIGISSHDLKLETKLLIDRNTRTLSHALNLVHEIEFEKGTSHPENKVEIDYGLSRHLSRQFNVGLELREDNVFVKGSELGYSRLFAGPGLSYKNAHYWLAFTVLPQVYSFKEQNESNPKVIAGHEKVETRLIFAF